MAATKDQFQRNKELREAWGIVATSDNWKLVQAFAKGELMEYPLSSEAHIGAMRMLHILNNLSSGEEAEFHWPSSGLKHTPEHPKPRSIFDEPQTTNAT